MSSIEFCDLAAIERRLDTFRGRVAVVNHFATWCTGCVDELPLLVRLQAETKPDDEVRFLGICWELFMHDGPHERVAAELAEFAGAHGLEFPILVYTGEPEALFMALGISSGTIPHTAVYGRDGAHVQRFEAPLETEEDVTRVRHAIEIGLARR